MLVRSWRRSHRERRGTRDQAVLRSQSQDSQDDEGWTDGEKSEQSEQSEQSARRAVGFQGRDRERGRRRGCG